jgi:phosphonate degradation associated HDIG domain protein
MALSIDDIVGLFSTRGQTQYGREAVNQLDHALQCAQLAEQAGETHETVAAALLHDLGHLIAAEQAEKSDDKQDGDDLHQFIALPFLRARFPEAVLAPVRMHVAAKRYLCAVEHGYWERLSPASKRSLELQGGAFDRAEAEAFAASPYAAEAVRVRRYDDQAKVPGLAVPDIAHYAKVLEAVAQ